MGIIPAVPIYMDVTKLSRAYLIYMTSRTKIVQKSINCPLFGCCGRAYTRILYAGMQGQILLYRVKGTIIMRRHGKNNLNSGLCPNCILCGTVTDLHELKTTMTQLRYHTPSSYCNIRICRGV